MAYLGVSPLNTPSPKCSLPFLSTIQHLVPPVKCMTHVNVLTGLMNSGGY